MSKTPIFVWITAAIVFILFAITVYFLFINPTEPITINFGVVIAGLFIFASFFLLGYLMRKFGNPLIKIAILLLYLLIIYLSIGQFRDVRYFICQHTRFQSQDFDPGENPCLKNN
ncbi:MAG TPA: hypothetical protein VLE47_03070 [Candidatus Saccharimonadales bacterium]|nr:hypothetical protein [Candidatus Saccharimonadales bacterium]